MIPPNCRCPRSCRRRQPRTEQPDLQHDPGADLMNLLFEQKVYGLIFCLEIWTKLLAKTSHIGIGFRFFMFCTTEQ
jgi:hypothetical protein